MPALAEVTPVYFGNGCFWGRQKDFVDTEMKLGRTANSATAVVGYAGGQENQKPACYYYNSPESQYERQGHAEVVQVGLNSEKAKDELAMFAETYFNQFTKTRQGMIRSVRALRFLHNIHCTRADVHCRLGCATSKAFQNRIAWAIVQSTQRMCTGPARPWLRVPQRCRHPWRHGL